MQCQPSSGDQVREESLVLISSVLPSDVSIQTLQFDGKPCNGCVDGLPISNSILFKVDAALDGTDVGVVSPVVFEDVAKEVGVVGLPVVLTLSGCRS